MVLTDREIQVAIQNDQIVINPSPAPTAFSSTSLDLGLSKYLRVWRSAEVAGVEEYVVCPAVKDFKFADVLKKCSDPKEMGSEGHVVEPGDFILGWTLEAIKFPVLSRVAARVEGKSSLARLGIGIHITAPTIHAGFEGPIQLEICNHGTVRVRLLEGMPVCQLIFEQTLSTPQQGYTGQFLGQTPK
jgi:dCTP deaminase